MARKITLDDENEIDQLGDYGDQESDSLEESQLDAEREIDSLNDILPTPENSTENYPGATAGLYDRTGLTPPILPKKIPVRVEEKRETPTVQKQLPPETSIVRGGKPTRQIPGTDAPPKLEYSEFTYPEFKKSNIQDPRSSANLERLYAHLGMAGNDILKGLTRFQPSNDVYESMLDTAKQNDKLYATSKASEQKRLSDYLKNKQASMQAQRKSDVDLYGKKLGAWAITQKLKQNLEKGNKETSYGLKKLDEEIAPDYKSFLANGDPVRARNTLENLGKISHDLQYDQGFIDELKRGKTYILQRNIPYAGADWSKLGFPRIAAAQNKIQRMFMRDLRPILGAQFTAEEAKRVIESSFDALLRPEDSLETIQQIIDEKRAELAAKEDMYRYYEHNGFTMNGYVNQNRRKEKFEIIK